MTNNYDEYAKLRHERIISGQMKSIVYVEKPMMMSMMPDIKDKKVLLIGCGTGEEVELLKKFEPKSITGIDLSSNSIEIAKENYKDCKFFVCDMNNMNFPSNSFDFVYSSLAINYSSNFEKLFNDINNILDKNGMFLFSACHPMRFASKKIEYNNKKYHLIGFEEGSSEIIGSYNTTLKKINYFENNVVLEEYIASPSTLFQTLKKCNFFVEDFKESACVEECREVDEDYYNRFKEIPQFMAFLSKKVN